MNSKKISVIIVEYNREAHLKNVLKAIESSSKIPDEVVIVTFSKSLVIERNAYALHILLIQLDKPDNSGLPMARARNLGAKKASSNYLLFLDVDCIPSKNLIKTITEQLYEFPEALIMGNPKYLIKSIPSNMPEFYLESNSVYHPRRPTVTNLSKEFRYELFWSLCFVITRKQIKKLGYFDETYTGYGAEDTDLAFQAKKLEIPFYLSNAVVFHQHHVIFRPPLHQMENIVNNCNHFYKKWNIWAMDKHLHGFKKLGYINWDSNQKQSISIIRLPNVSEVENSKVLDEAYG